MPAALISALVYGACFPSTPFSLVIFFSLVPLFTALERAESLRAAVLRGALFGAVYPVIIAYWIFIALHSYYQVSIVPSLLFLLGVLSVPLGLLYAFFALAYRFLRRDSLFFHCLVLPSLWVLLEFVKEIVPLYLPWGLAGYGLASFPRLIQSADLTGVYGISFFVVMVNSLTAYALREVRWADLSLRSPGAALRGLLRVAAGPGRVPLIVTGAVTAAVLVYGCVQLPRWRALASGAPPSSTLTARVVQGNFAQRDRWDSANLYEVLERSLTLTGDVKGDGGRFLVVWPETVINAGRAMRDSILARIIHDIGGNSLLVFGGTRQASGGDDYNSAYFVSGKGPVKVYDKTILLPFAETTPFGISLLGAYYEAPVRFEPGTLPAVAALDGVAVGFSICFEKIYSWYLRRQADRGAGILVNISNDSWFGRSTNPYQNLDIGALRAVENRRYLVIASNSGLSAVIAPGGEVVARTRLFTAEKIDARVSLITARSVYTAIGDVMLYAAALVIGVALWVALKES